AGGHRVGDDDGQVEQAARGVFGTDAEQRLSRAGAGLELPQARPRVGRHDDVRRVATVAGKGGEQVHQSVEVVGDRATVLDVGHVEQASGRGDGGRGWRGLGQV